MKSALIALMLQSALFNVSYAKDSLPSAPVSELNLSLDHMSLTTQEIKKRDELLKPIYDNYESVNLSSVANAIEGAYGVNVYHHMNGKVLDLKNKKNVMENATRFFMGDTTSLFDSAAEGVLEFKGAVPLAKKDYYGNAVYTTMSAELIEGNEKKFRKYVDISTPSVLATEVVEKNINDVFFRSKIGERRAVYTTTNARLFTAPVMNDFIEAMKNLNLKALDATVNFLNTDIPNSTKTYKVIYPTYSKIAPIPQPVIFISKSASYGDIVEMLTEHAPKIYAYNKLLVKNLLPSVNDINDLLKKYPNLLKEVEKKVGQVKRENLVNAIQSAFLNVTYGTGVLLTAPIALGAMAASAVLSPIFLATVVVLVVI